MEPDEANVIRWAVALASGKPTEDMPPALKRAVAENPNGLSVPKIAEELNRADLRISSYLRRNKYRVWRLKNPEGLFSESFVSNIFFKEDL